MGLEGWYALVGLSWSLVWTVWCLTPAAQDLFPHPTERFVVFGVGFFFGLVFWPLGLLISVISKVEEKLTR